MGLREVTGVNKDVHKDKYANQSEDAHENK